MWVLAAQVGRLGCGRCVHCGASCAYFGLIFGHIFWFIWAHFARLSCPSHHPFWARLGSNWAHYGLILGLLRSSFGRAHLVVWKTLTGAGLRFAKLDFQLPPAKAVYQKSKGSAQKLPHSAKLPTPKSYPM